MVALRRVLVVALAWSLAVGVPAGSWASAASAAPQGQAPGRPYSGDCSVVLPQAAQLEKGLAVQRDAIRRAEAIINAAKAGTPRPSQAGAAVDSAKSVITSLLSEGAALRKKLEALQLNADASASRTRILKDLDNINSGAGVIDALLAGGKYQQAASEVNNLRELTEVTGTYLVDSGLGDMLASTLGKHVLGEALGGPAGVLMMQAATLAIEVGARLAEEEINASEVAQAEATRDAIKFQVDAIQSRIQFMKDTCTPESRPEPKSKAKPAPPSDPPPASQGGKRGQATTARTGRSAGQVAAMAVLLGGGAAGVVYAASMLKTLNTGGGCDTSKAPINQINTYCFGSTRNTTLCNQYIAQYDSFCKSCGFSGFDANQGACK